MPYGKHSVLAVIPPLSQPMLVTFDCPSTKSATRSPAHPDPSALGVQLTPVASGSRNSNTRLLLPSSDTNKLLLPSTATAAGSVRLKDSFSPRLLAVITRLALWPASGVPVKPAKGLAYSVTRSLRRSATY